MAIQLAGMNLTVWIVRLSAVLLVITAVACSGEQSTAPAAGAPGAAAAGGDESIPATKSPYDSLPDSIQQVLDKPFTGDLDEMVKRRVIRVGVTYNRTHYFVDMGQERGITYESLKSFDEELNKELKTGNLRVHVVPVITRRDQLAPALLEGRIDMVAAMVTVRPEVEAVAAVSAPTRTNVSEVVVTGPGAPAIRSLDDLSGQEVFIRRTSPYFDSITRLNADFRARGKEPVLIAEAPDVLEDDDILEMVNAGLTPITIVDDFLADFWSQVFKDLKVHNDLAVRKGGNLAVAFRKNNPKLKAQVDKWVKKHSKGDLFRNVMERRYLENIKYAKNASTDAERRKFLGVIELFKKYGGQYSLDYLLMAAQGYQESTLDQNVKSRVGAIGVMQVMPPTGKQLNVGDISKIEPNIHAGVKYMRFMMDQYYKDEPMDDLNKALMTFASYNAGPGRIRQLRRETEKRGLNPNLWFGNVERIASERIGRETVTYVSNIFKYYLTYRLLSEQDARRDAAKAAVEKRR